MTDNRRLSLVVYVLLAAATIAVYGQVAAFPFVIYDDDRHVYENPHVAGGLTWPNIVWAFGIHGPSQWHPVAWLSHQLDSELFGLNAGRHHLVNLLLHVAGVLLLLRAMDRMTGAFWPSALVAAMFALHPLHVESVAWVSERRDVLCGLFFMLTLISYQAYAQHGGWGRYLLVVGCFALGLMSKPMLVTVPCLLLLLDVWPLGRLRVGRLVDEPAKLGWLVLEKVPLLALSAGSSVLTILCQRSAGAMPSLEEYSLPMRLANAALSYVAYLRKMVWPSDLAVFYPWRTEWLAWQVIAALALLAAITIAALLLFRRRPYLAIGWFWYLGTLLPVSGLFQTGGQSMADRFTYIPLIGIYIAIAWSGADLARRAAEPRQARLAAGGAAGLVLSALMACTWTQVRHWRDSDTLFDHALAVTTDNATMHNNRGNTYLAAGKYDKALADFDKAIELKPNYMDPYYNRGKLYQDTDRLSLALADYDQAIAIKPDRAHPYHNRGTVHHRMGRFDLALRDYSTAIELDPGIAEAYFNRAAVYLKLDQVDRGLADYDQAVRLRPNFASAYFSRGTAYRELGDYGRAMADYHKAIQLEPQNAEFYHNRGITLRQMGKPDLAIQDYNQTIALAPKFADAYFNRGNAYRELNQPGPALADYSKAIDLDPTMAEAYANRAVFYFLMNRFDEARADVQQVGKLGGQLPPDFIQALENASGRSQSHGVE